MTDPIRIGNAQAFWGDRGNAAAEMLAREPSLDYLTLDYLAEVSMSILARQRERDPDAGYAVDFVDVVRSLAPYWAGGGKSRLITNAGGLNPGGCAEACRGALEAAGCRALRIGIVTGDDVLPILCAAQGPHPSPLPGGEGEGGGAEAFRNLDTGSSLDEVRDGLTTANAYLGAAPLVEALSADADIVITGRVADPSLVVAACVHHFGWNEGDFDRLAGATIAGHMIECGTQVTGGISTDWLEVPDPAHLGFPIVEVAEDGSCVVTKPPDTGGRVSAMTVKEQLVYEIGDPESYLSPDVTVSFLSLRVEDLGDNRVRVHGASGRPRPETYKVSATFHDGFRAAGTLTIVGRQAAEKARRCGEIVLQRVRDAGFVLRDSVVECLGAGGGAGIVGAGDNQREGFGETVLRIAVEAESRDAVERFSRELMPLITAGPQGTTGYAEGRPRVQPLVRHWPCLISRDAIYPQVDLMESAEPSKTAIGEWLTPGRASVSNHSAHRVPARDVPTTLFDIACARSGDKGNRANIGVIARNPAAWEFLRDWLTSDRVSSYFSSLGLQSVERFELPNLQALNFVLRGALARGLRCDAQGKALGQMLLEMALPQDLPRTMTMSEGS